MAEYAEMATAQHVNDMLRFVFTDVTYDLLVGDDNRIYQRSSDSSTEHKPITILCQDGERRPAQVYTAVIDPECVLINPLQQGSATTEQEKWVAGVFRTSITVRMMLLCAGIVDLANRMAAASKAKSKKLNVPGPLMAILGKIAGNVDDKTFPDITATFQSCYDIMFSLAYSKNMLKTTFSSGVLDERHPAVKSACPRQKTFTVLQAIVSEVFGVTDGTQMAQMYQYSVSTEAAVPAKFHTNLHVMAQIFQRTNVIFDALQEAGISVDGDCLVDLETLMRHLEQMPAYYTVARCVLAGAPTAVATPSQAARTPTVPMATMPAAMPTQQPQVEQPRPMVPVPPMPVVQTPMGMMQMQPGMMYPQPPMMPAQGMMMPQPQMMPGMGMVQQPQMMQPMMPQPQMMPGMGMPGMMMNPSGSFIAPMGQFGNSPPMALPPLSN